MTRTPLVVVEWSDAAHEFGWIEGDGKQESDELTIVTSVGFLLHKSKGQVKICQTVAPGSHAQTLSIPRGMVKSITRIKHKATQ